MNSQAESVRAQDLERRTFLLTIFATFLTRSGLIESVHSFAQELKIAYIFLTFMGSILVASVGQARRVGVIDGRAGRAVADHWPGALSATDYIAITLMTLVLVTGFYLWGY